MARLWSRLEQFRACRFAVALLLGSLAPVASTAAETWSPALPISTDVTAEGARPRSATDEKGRFTTVWQRDATGKTMVSRSTNYGQTWTAALDLPNPDGRTSFGTPAVAGDITSSTFMAAWPVDPDIPHPIALARAGLIETNYGSIGILPYGGTNGYDGLLLPAIEAGGNRVWITAGSTLNTGSGDEALAFMRTADDGVNWTFQGLLGESGGAVQADRNVALARDRGNNAWVAVWERRFGSIDSPSGIDVLYSRSGDNGLTWAVPAPLHADAPAGRQPTIASPVSNAFVAAYVNGTGLGSLKAKRSADGGATWAAPIDVNTAGAAGHDTPVDPHLASDGQGNVVMVWAGSASNRRKLYFSTSENAGLTWTAADVLTTAPASQEISDTTPQVRYDGNGQWLTVWQRARFGSGAGHQIMSSRLVFPVRADLSVSQVDSPDPAKVGGTVTYKMTVRNRGPVAATGVVLTCTPPTTNTLNISSSDGTHESTSQTITFTIGDMAVNKTVTAEFSAVLNKTGNYQNVAVLTSNESDIDVEDRTSIERTTVLIEGIDLQGKWTSFVYEVPRRIERGRLHIDATLDYSNFGTKRARAGIITWYLSDDEILSDDDAFAGRRHVDMVLRGRTREIRFTKLMSRYIPWENRYLIAILDSEKRITEVDETNNVVMSQRLLVP